MMDEEMLFAEVGKYINVWGIKEFDEGNEITSSC